MELRRQLTAIAISVGLVAGCVNSTEPLFQRLLQRSGIAAGAAHACRLASNGLASCWGDNSHGELGDGSETSSATPVPVSGGLRFNAMAAGASRTCGIVVSGLAYCWGGELLGSARRRVDDEPGSSHPGLGRFEVRGPDVGRESQLRTHQRGSGLLLGYNDSGRLGNGDSTSSPIPVAVAGGLRFSAIGAGGFYTCGITTAGAAYCWGVGPLGQSGGPSASSPVPVAVATPSSNPYVPVAVSGGLTFTAIDAGAEHSCGLTSAGAAYCWGDNSFGQLGTGSLTGSPVPVAVSGGLTFSAIDAGWTHTCGLTVAGTISCWGNGYYGQLGLGRFGYSTVPVAVQP